MTRLSDEEIARIRRYWGLAPWEKPLAPHSAPREYAREDITALLAEIDRLRRIETAAREAISGRLCECDFDALRAALDGNGGERG